MAYSLSSLGAFQFFACAVPKYLFNIINMILSFPSSFLCRGTNKNKSIAAL